MDGIFNKNPKTCRNICGIGQHVPGCGVLVRRGGVEPPMFLCNGFTVRCLRHWTHRRILCGVRYRNPILEPQELRIDKFHIIALISCFVPSVRLGAGFLPIRRVSFSKSLQTDSNRHQMLTKQLPYHWAMEARRCCIYDLKHPCTISFLYSWRLSRIYHKFPGT